MTNHSINPFLKRLWLVLGNLFWLGLWLFGLSLLLLYPLRWLSGDYFAPVRMINYVLPWLLALIIPAIVMAALARRKWLVATLIVPFLLIGLTFAPHFMPRSHAPLPHDAFSLKIMSHNLQFNNRNANALADLIRQEQPDILLLQEFRQVLTSTLFLELADLYPEGKLYIDVVNEPQHWGGFFQAVLSRYPLTRTSTEYNKGRAQKVMVETAAGPIAVWNVHPVPPFMRPPQEHDEQIRALVDDIAAMDSPLIVAGDFNATDQSASYRLLNRYLHNAQADAGRGLGFSFPAHEIVPPLFRIDHIFYSHHFVAYHAKTLSTSGGSDHFPIMAELEMTTK